MPGKQIDPEDPRRWMLVKREMEVPDPSTGATRWSIDFFLLDKDAIPTFVECKRLQDTRSRRARQMKELVTERLQITVRRDYGTKFHTLGIAEWASIEPAISQLLKDLTTEFRASAV